jgi:hypothetical protein
MNKSEIPQLVRDDPWLEPYTDVIADRIRRFNRLADQIRQEAGSIRIFHRLTCISGSITTMTGRAGGIVNGRPVRMRCT